MNVIRTAAPLLLISPDARAGGLGDAGCASSPDVYSNYWNASKNIFAEKENGISFSWTPWLRALVPGINLYDISMYTKVGKKNAIGISTRYFSEGDITFTNVVGSVIGQFHPYEHSESISFAHRMTHNFSVGIAGKYIYSQLAGNGYTSAGESFAVDVSCYKRDTINFIKSNDVFAWGINISNVGQKISYSQNMQKEFLPQNLRVGISYKVNINTHNSIEFICDANKLLVPTPPIYDTVQYQFGYLILKGRDPNRSVFNALYTSFYDA
ncbi:MAG: type IX secretion system outer membrane channel protein PorV, partial [Bacteroidia bacterium]